MSGSEIGRTVPTMPEVIHTITDEQREAGRRTVAQHATDADDAVRLLLMLGIFPGQEEVGFQIPDAYRFDWCL